jgi:hypothetical protein
LLHLRGQSFGVLLKIHKDDKDNLKLAIAFPFFIAWFVGNAVWMASTTPSGFREFVYNGSSLFWFIAIALFLNHLRKGTFAG